MKESIMQRRRFIQASMNGCLVAPLAAVSVGNEVDAVAVLRELMGKSPMAPAIGRVCLELGLAEPQVVRDFVAGLGDGASSRQMIEDRFHSRRQSDFAEERLRSVHGWQLAESEVLAFAAVALS